MKSNFYLLTLVLSGMFSFSSCKKIALKTLDKNQVALHSCTEQNVQMPYICFDSLIQDSRCPTGGVCVWRGTAIIQVTFHDNGQSDTFIMSLKDYPSLGHVSDTTINGYNISFTALDPYPDINKNAGDKIATVNITQ